MNVLPSYYRQCVCYYEVQLRTKLLDRCGQKARSPACVHRTGGWAVESVDFVIDGGAAQFPAGRGDPEKRKVKSTSIIIVSIHHICV